MKLLFVDACLRGDKSRTKYLCDKIISEIADRYKTVKISSADLKSLNLSPATTETLEKRDKLIADGDYTAFGLAKAFAEADIIVIGAPYWDLSFPAALKIYIENIAVNGIAFKYTERGQEGLCKAEKLYYITTSGGYIGEADYGFGYIKGICKLFGIPECVCISAEGLDIIGNDVDRILDDAVKRGIGMI